MAHQKNFITERPLNQLIGGILLSTKVGDRLPSVRKMSEQLGVSLGAVSQSLNCIEEAGAVQLESQGRLGTFVRSKDIGLLWSFTIGEPMIIAFPLPSTPRLEGLATAVKRAFSDAGIDIFFMFIRGSRNRMHALRQRKCHLTVMSSFAAKHLCHSDEIYETLPTETFISEHKVFFLDTNIWTHKRVIKVAVDKDSFDQQALSEMEFKDELVEWVPTTYPQLSRLLLNGNVDAILWTVDEIAERNSPDILNRPMKELVKNVQDESTCAAFIASRDFMWLDILFSEVLLSKKIVGIQNAVLAGHVVPEY
jgi:DNA-binding transcriptional ArsR family regulator